MTNLIYVLGASFCESQAIVNVMYLVGLVVFGIKVVVPIILIIVGMTKFVTAISHQDDKEVKKAQEALVQKAIAAVIVFLITMIVGLLMGIIGGTAYEDCMPCINNAFGSACNPDFTNTTTSDDIDTGLGW